MEQNRELLVCNLWSSLGETVPSAESREGEERETGHSRLVGGRLNRQENLSMRLVLSSYEMNGCPPPLLPLARIFFFKVIFFLINVKCIVGGSVG